MTLSNWLSPMLFIVIGVLFLLSSSGLQLGTFQEPGPGLFPVVLAASLIVLAGIYLVKQRSSRVSEGVEGEGFGDQTRREYRILIVLALCVAVFGYAVEWLGLVLTTIAVATVARVTLKGASLTGLAALSAVLLALVVGIFHYGLGMPIKLWVG